MKTFKTYTNESKNNINEAVNAKKVYEYLISTMTLIQNEGKHYVEDKQKVDKLNRRILTDYAGDDKKLKEIYKQITKIANDLGNGLDDLEKIIG